MRPLRRAGPIALVLLGCLRAGAAVDARNERSIHALELAANATPGAAPLGQGWPGPERAAGRRRALTAAAEGCSLQPASDGHAAFLPHGACAWAPPVLYSFPGSGNSYFRQLLERATGIATGSAYDDTSLRAVFVGERRCDTSTLVVKAHAMHTPVEAVRFWQQRADAQHGAPAVRRGHLPWHGAEARNPAARHLPKSALKYFFSRCHRWRPTRALFLDRHPLDAIYAETQRLYYAGDSGGHVDSLGGTELSRALSAHLAESALSLAQAYLATWASHRRFAKRAAAEPDGANATFTASFERLVTPAGCVTELTRALRWLAPPAGPAAASSRRLGEPEHAAALQRRARLACSAPADPRLHRADARGSPPTAEHGTGGPHHRHAWPPALACRVWAVVGHIANRLGHAPPADQSGAPCADRDALALELARAGARASPNGRTVVFTTTSEPYVDVTLNFLLSVRVHAGVEMMPVVGALDWHSHDELRTLGAAVFPLIPRYTASRAMRPDEGDIRFDGVWIERGALALLLLRAGLDVLMCDSDAVWLDDVLPRVSRLAVGATAGLSSRPADAVASAGTFPEAARRALGGSTAVMGFVLLRSTPPMLAFASGVQALSEEIGDDQVAFNTELAAHVRSVAARPDVLPSAPRSPPATVVLVTASAHGDGLNRTDGRLAAFLRSAGLPSSALADAHALTLGAVGGAAAARVRVGSSSAAGAGAAAAGATSPSLQVAILPPVVIVRQCTREGLVNGRALVAHCLTPKMGGAKALHLHTLGLWYLPHNWRVHTSAESPGSSAHALLVRSGNGGARREEAGSEHRAHAETDAAADAHVAPSARVGGISAVLARLMRAKEIAISIIVPADELLAPGAGSSSTLVLAGRPRSALRRSFPRVGPTLHALAVRSAAEHFLKGVASAARLHGIRVEVIFTCAVDCVPATSAAAGAAGRTRGESARARAKADAAGHLVSMRWLALPARAHAHTGPSGAPSVWTSAHAATAARAARKRAALSDRAPEEPALGRAAEAINVAMRFAAADLVALVSARARLTPAFFSALREIAPSSARQSVPDVAFAIGSCDASARGGASARAAPRAASSSARGAPAAARVDACLCLGDGRARSCAAHADGSDPGRSDPAAAAAASDAASAACAGCAVAGVLLPKARWVQLHGLAEGAAVRTEVDRLLAFRVQAANMSLRWLPCRAHSAQSSVEHRRRSHAQRSASASACAVLDVAASRGHAGPADERLQLHWWRGGAAEAADQPLPVAAGAHTARIAGLESAAGVGARGGAYSTPVPQRQRARPGSSGSIMPGGGGPASNLTSARTGGASAAPPPLVAELGVLRSAGVRRDWLSSCAWGLRGASVHEYSVAPRPSTSPDAGSESAGGGGPEAAPPESGPGTLSTEDPLGGSAWQTRRTPVTLPVPDDTSGDYSPLGPCWSRARERREFRRWAARATSAEPLLVVVVLGDVASRVRALGSALALARELNLVPVVVWQADSECEAEYDDLFERSERSLVLSFDPLAPDAAAPGADGARHGRMPPAELAATAGRRWAEYPRRGWRGDDHRPLVISAAHSSGTNLHVRTRTVLISALRKYSVQAFASALAGLRPRQDDLGPLIEHAAQAHRVGGAIGVHVGTNRSAGDSSAPRVRVRRPTAERCPPVSPALRAIAARVAHSPGTAFAFTCDPGAAGCEHLAEARRATQPAPSTALREAIAPVQASACALAPASRPCQRLRLVELWLLSRATQLVIPQPSAFGEVARLLLYGRWLQTAMRQSPAAQRFTWPLVTRVLVACGAAPDYMTWFDTEGYALKQVDMPLSHALERWGRMAQHGTANRWRTAAVMKNKKAKRSR